MVRLVALLLCGLWLTPVWAASDKPLELWVGSDKGYRGIALVAKRFERETGVRLRVRHFDDLPRQFEQSATQGQGPDILIWAHDRYGEWAQRGWIIPVEPSEQTRKSIAPFTWPAVTVDGQIYGFPMAVESVALIYNRALIGQPPAAFEQLFELRPQLALNAIGTITWDYTNPYFSWGLLSANGGYSFKGKNGHYDTDHTGVDAPGAVTGAWLLKRLLNQGVLDPELTGDQALQAFMEGRVAMTIGGPWIWQRLRDAGIDFGVAPLPTVAGQPPKPFVGVWAAAVTEFSSQPQQAVRFLEDYLLTLEGLQQVNADTPLGPAANNKLMQQLTVDPNIFVAFRASLNGELMPHDPKMSLFWASLKRALEQIRLGTLTPQQALIQARERIIGVQPEPTD